MKRTIAVLTALTFLMFATAFSTVAKTTYKLGDANKDGSISIADATEIQRYLVDAISADKETVKLYDTDGDGEASIMDVTCIQMYLAHIIDDFPGNNVVAPTSPPTDSDGYYDQVVKP